MHPEILVCLLTQQIIHASIEKGQYERRFTETAILMTPRPTKTTMLTTGLQEARLLLKDWLVNLLGCYNQNLNFVTHESSLDIVDESFARYLHAPILDYENLFGICSEEGTLP